MLTFCADIFNVWIVYVNVCIKAIYISLALDLIKLYFCIPKELEFPYAVIS